MLEIYSMGPQHLETAYVGQLAQLSSITIITYMGNISATQEDEDRADDDDDDMVYNSAF